jgi:hypothetical protein
VQASDKEPRSQGVMKEMSYILNEYEHETLIAPLGYGKDVVLTAHLEI